MVIIRLTSCITGDEAMFNAEHYGEDNFEDVIRSIEEMLSCTLNDEQRLMVKTGDIEQNFPIAVSYYDDEDWEDYEIYAPEAAYDVIKDIADTVVGMGNDCNPTDVWLLFDRLSTIDFGLGEIACLESYWEDYGYCFDPMTMFRFVESCIDEYVYADSYDEFGKKYLYELSGETLPDGLEDYVEFSTFGTDVLDGNPDYIDLIDECSIVVINVGAWPASTHYTTRFRTYQYQQIITHTQYEALCATYNTCEKPKLSFNTIRINDISESGISTFLNC